MSKENQTTEQIKNTLGGLWGLLLNLLTILLNGGKVRHGN